MEIPDVPIQYKEITDDCVLGLAHAAEKIWPIVGELCGESFEIDTGDLIITIKRKLKDGVQS